MSTQLLLRESVFFIDNPLARIRYTTGLIKRPGLGAVIVFPGSLTLNPSPGEGREHHGGEVSEGDDADHPADCNGCLGWVSRRGVAACRGVPPTSHRPIHRPARGVHLLGTNLIF